MKTNHLNASGMEELSLAECGEITGGKVTCITGSDGTTVRVERTVDASGHVTITVTRDPFCRIGGVKHKEK